jgi:hypothetical protein
MDAPIRRGHVVETTDDTIDNQTPLAASSPRM